MLHLPGHGVQWVGTYAGAVSSAAPTSSDARALPFETASWARRVLALDEIADRLPRRQRRQASAPLTELEATVG